MDIEPVQLRFLFDVANLSYAADLAVALRVGGRTERVQVRPAKKLGHWTIVATTTPLAAEWDRMITYKRRMEELARLYPGCELAGWRRLG